MPIVQDILATKGKQVHTISPSITVLEATQRMNQYKIGALLVVVDGGHVAGIFTERDVLRRVVAVEKAPSEITVAEAMTAEVICVQPETDLDEVSKIMKEKRVRHLPVCDSEGKLHGMISIGDVNAFHASAQEAQIHFLNDYIYGRV